MANYPTALPAILYVDAAAELDGPPTHESLHDGMRDELLAIATALGLQPAGQFPTVRARIDDGFLGRSIFTRTAIVSAATDFNSPVQFETEVRDDDGWGAATDSTFVCPAAGLYAFGVNCTVETAGGAALHIIGGTVNDESVLLTNAAAVARTGYLRAGAELEVHLFEDSAPGSASQFTLTIQRLT